MLILGFKYHYFVLSVTSFPSCSLPSNLKLGERSGTAGLCSALVRLSEVCSPSCGDESVLHVAAGSHKHAFLRFLIACTTDCIREQAPCPV